MMEAGGKEGGCELDRSQSLFNFVPQEKNLTALHSRLKLMRSVERVISSPFKHVPKLELGSHFRSN